MNVSRSENGCGLSVLGCTGPVLAGVSPVVML